MGDLLPCPFCGNGASYIKHSAGIPGTNGFDSWHAVACRSCGATVGACDRRFRNKDDAAKVWNRRAPLNSGSAPGASDGVKGDSDG